MKQLISITVLLLICINTFSQDKLIGLHNDTLLVKVTEITPKEIKYKMADNPDGPLITVNKNEYSAIQYANGTSQILQDAKAVRKRIIYKNSINIDFMSFLTNEIEINYERLLKGNMIGIQVPVRAGWSNNNLRAFTNLNSYYYYNNSPYSSYYSNSDIDFSLRTGAFIKFYYNKPAIVRGYSGIEFITGVFKSTTDFTFYDENTSTYKYYSLNNTQGVLGFMAITGFKVTPYPRITFSIDGGGGYGGIFNSHKTENLNGVEYRLDKNRNGTGIWKVCTSIGINF
ncbi:MAG TPA: hypothetical protein PLW43_05520 [Chitinophagales bacterium]|nr:hypothetical protein [Chitinophagales bacterium]